MSEARLPGRRLPQLPQLPQETPLVQPFNGLLPLTTPTRTLLRVHRARPRGQPPSLCFLCGEEGHLASKCLTLQRLLRQPTPARLLERPSEPKVAEVGCRVCPQITGQLMLEGIPILGLVDTGASVTCMGFDIWRRFSV